MRVILPTNQLSGHPGAVQMLVLVFAGSALFCWWMFRGAELFIRTPQERAERGAEARAEGARSAAAFIATLDLPVDDEPGSSAQR